MLEGKALIYSKKCDSRIETCGSPEDTLTAGELVLLKETQCEVPVKKLAIQLTREGLLNSESSLRKSLE